MPEQDLVRYFCLHPAGGKELAQWMLDVGISWWGVDTGSADHPMNTTIRYMRPDLAKRFEQKVGMPAEKYFGQYEYRHPRSGRLVQEELFPLHYLLFPSGCVHAENVGGDIAKVLNQRCIIGAFPWKFEGGEACPCRILAFFDVGGMVVKD
jgi:kynurenine formamidase